MPLSHEVSFIPIPARHGWSLARGGGEHREPRSWLAIRPADLGVLLGLTAVWIGCIILINPVGDFPLNDDWSYGLCVRRLVETGRFQLGDWTSMPLVTQVLWGRLFSLPGGFSFTALRVSTLVLGSLGISTTYGLLRLIGIQPLVGAVGALTLAANPLYLSLSHTFMTDVPFAATALLASLFFLIGLRFENKWVICAGILVSIASTLIRQLGLVVPLGFGAAWIVRNGLSRHRLLMAAAPLLLTAVALILYNHWLAVRQPMPSLYGKQTQELVDAVEHPLLLARHAGRRLFESASLIGLFSLPVLLVCRNLKDAKLSRSQRGIRFVVVGGFIVMSAVHLLLGDLIPRTNNVLTSYGIGPTVLHDTMDGSAPWAPLPRWFWTIVTVSAGIGGAALLWRTLSIQPLKRIDCSDRRDLDQQCAVIFAMTVLVAYVMIIHIIAPLDRYLLFTLPFWWMIIAAGSNQAPIPLSPGIWKFMAPAACSILLGGYFIFSVSASHDYLAFNRARWELLREAMNAGVAPSHIDGGFEFNGLFQGGGDSRAVATSPFSTNRANYCVTIAPVNGYDAVATESYPSWLNRASERVYLLRERSQP